MASAKIDVVSDDVEPTNPHIDVSGVPASGSAVPGTSPTMPAGSSAVPAESSAVPKHSPGVPVGGSSAVTAEASAVPVVTGGGYGTVHPPMSLEGGTTTVSSVVVAKIAGLAAREVAGVHSLGVGTARSVTAVRDRIPSIAPPPSSPGVSVEVGQTQTAIDLDIVVEFGIPITQIARAVRRHVIERVEEFTGLQVVEVNITVDDVNLPPLVAGGNRLT